MSQPEVSTQDSTDTQEILSQDSFEEIWKSLGRTFSNPEKMMQGVMTDEIPLTIEYKDQTEPDNLQVQYEQRILRNLGQPCSPTGSQQLSELLQSPSQGDSQFLNIQNGHTEPMVNGTSTRNNMIYEPIELPSILPNNNHPGPFNFSIDFEPNTEPITKATPWVYSADRHKLFVKMQSVCPILFRINGNPPPGSGVRGIMMYKRPEHYKDIVLRCPNHKNTFKDDHPYQDHVMRCENASTIYESCPKTERLSLFIPLNAVVHVEGEGYFKELFKFTCFNSCVGGMNRRPTYLLFRLECRGKLCGRAVVEVRVCASPGRDSTEKDVGANQKNTKNTDKRNSSEPSSTTDDITPMPIASTSSPGSSPTTAYPPRASVLMSVSKDRSSAPEPFQFPSVEKQPKKREYAVSSEGFVYKKMKKSCPADSTDDEVYTVLVRGRDRYEILQKINEGLHVLDGIVPPGQHINRYANSCVEPSQEFTKIQPKTSLVEIKKEKPDSSQCNMADISPNSSQENSIHEMSQLSRTSSNASSQSSTTANGQEYSALKFTMRRTISLKKSVLPKGLQDAS